MPLELAVWRIDCELRALGASGLNLEERLETLPVQAATVANPGWMARWRHTVEGLRVRFGIRE